jgi:hypothetical protein
VILPAEGKAGNMKKSRSKRAESPSELIDARIADLGDWRGEMLSRLRALIMEAGPEVADLEFSSEQPTEERKRGWSSAVIPCSQVHSRVT